MILVKPAESAELAAIEMMVAENRLAYDAPRWAQAKVSSVVLRDGVISAAVFLRQTAETYLILNPALAMRKRERLGDLLILHKELVAPAQRAGLTDIHCWIPPELEAQQFGRLLLHLGWRKALWPCYSREVK